MLSFISFLCGFGICFLWWRVWHVTDFVMMTAFSFAIRTWSKRSYKYSPFSISHPFLSICIFSYTLLNYSPRSMSLPTLLYIHVLPALSLSPRVSTCASMCYLGLGERERRGCILRETCTIYKDFISIIQAVVLEEIHIYNPLLPIIPLSHCTNLFVDFLLM